MSDFPSYEELEAKLWLVEHERDKLHKEVERLGNEFPILFHLRAYGDIKKAVAARCIDLGTPEAIKKEYGL